MLLCDAAQVSDGKLFILGGGWSMTGPDPVPSAVALKIDVDWHEAEASHHWELFLEDADGQPVLMETTEGYDEGVWKQMAQELGLQSLHLPEAHGGQARISGDHGASRMRMRSMPMFIGDSSNQKVAQRVARRG